MIIITPTFYKPGRKRLLTLASSQFVSASGRKHQSLETSSQARTDLLGRPSNFPSLTRPKPEMTKGFRNGLVLRNVFGDAMLRNYYEDNEARSIFVPICRFLSWDRGSRSHVSVDSKTCKENETTHGRDGSIRSAKSKQRRSRNRVKSWPYAVPRRMLVFWVLLSKVLNRLACPAKTSTRPTSLSSKRAWLPSHDFSSGFTLVGSLPQCGTRSYDRWLDATTECFSAKGL